MKTLLAASMIALVAASAAMAEPRHSTPSNLGAAVSNLTSDYKSRLNPEYRTLSPASRKLAVPSAGSRGAISWGTYASHPGRGWVMIRGEMTPHTAEAFSALAVGLANRFDEVTVWLISDGGSMLAGMHIGRVIRARGFTAGVPTGRDCASSCALAWLGGNRLILEDETSRVGFHQPRNIVTGAVSPHTLAHVTNYVASLGYSGALARLAILAPPSGMIWLNTDVAEAAGLDVEMPTPAN